MLHVLRITAGENIRKVIMNFETKDYPLKSKGFITSIQIWIRRIRDELDGHKGIHVNDKRVLRICRKYDIKIK